MNLSAYQLQCFIEKVRNIRGLDLGNYERDFLHRRILAAMLDRGISESNLEFLQKPFTPRDLALKVREVLDTI